MLHRPLSKAGATFYHSQVARKIKAPQECEIGPCTAQPLSRGWSRRSRWGLSPLQGGWRTLSSLRKAPLVASPTSSHQHAGARSPTHQSGGYKHSVQNSHQRGDRRFESHFSKSFMSGLDFFWIFLSLHPLK